MEFTARQIAVFLGGEVVGNMDVSINNVSKIEEGQPGTLTFLANPKYNEFIYTTQASAVLVNRSFMPEKEIKTTLIKVQDAYAALAMLMDMYVQSLPVKRGIEIPSFISQSSIMGENAYIGAFTYIGENVKIGANVKVHPQCWIGHGSVIDDDTIIYAGVKIYPETKIGKRCILHAGAVIGADGFGFAPQPDGTYKKLQQIGNVVIEDDVEIGANSTIDCATMGSTVVHKGVKIDNLVMLGHNVEVGENTVMASQAGVAGSSKIGKNCIIGGQAGISGHVTLGNNVTMASKSGASKNIKDNVTLMGVYGFDAAQYRKSHAVFRNLPEIVRELNQLKKEVGK